MLFDFDSSGGSDDDNLTTAHCEAFTQVRGDRELLGNWSISNDSAANLKLKTQAAPDFLVSPRVGATALGAGGSSLAVRADLSDNENYFGIEFHDGIGTSGREILTVAGWVRVPSMNSGNSVDLIQITAPSSVILNFQTVGAQANFRLHTASPGQFSSTIAIDTDTWYWVSLKHDSDSGDCYLEILDSAGASVDTATLSSVSAGNATAVLVGRTDATVASTPASPYAYFSGISIDLEDGTHPLGSVAEPAPSDLVEGYDYLAENLQRSARPVGFVDVGTPDWGSDYVELVQADGDEAIYDLQNDKGEIYLYFRATPQTVTNFRRLIELNGPASFNDIHVLAYNGSSIPYWIVGGSGGAASTVFSAGTTYHIWIEISAGNFARVYISTDGTKGSAEINDISSISATNWRYLTLRDGGTTRYSHFRSDSSPIGDNPS